MSDHSREIDATDPSDELQIGSISQEFRQKVEDIDQRMDEDHYWANSIADADADKDGRHKWATMKKLASGGSPPSDAGRFFVKEEDGTLTPFFTDGTTESTLLSVAPKGYLTMRIGNEDDNTKPPTLKDGGVWERSSGLYQAAREIIVPFIDKGEWSGGTTYAVGDFLTEGGKIYVCVLAGDSHATNEPTWPTTANEEVDDGTTKWRYVKVSGSEFRQTLWQADTVYEVGDIVIAEDGGPLFLECTTGGTSDSTSPTTPDTPGDTVSDNTVTWTALNKSGATWLKIYHDGSDYFGEYTQTEPSYDDDKQGWYNTGETHRIVLAFWFDCTNTVDGVSYRYKKVLGPDRCQPDGMYVASMVEEGPTDYGNSWPNLANQFPSCSMDVEVGDRLLIKYSQEDDWEGSSGSDYMSNGIRINNSGTAEFSRQSPYEQQGHRRTDPETTDAYLFYRLEAYNVTQWDGDRLFTTAYDAMESVEVVTVVTAGTIAVGDIEAHTAFPTSFRGKSKNRELEIIRVTR